MLIIYQKTSFIIGLCFLFVIIFLTILGPSILNVDPDKQESPSINKLKAPSVVHFFGTDQYGRDLFARVLYGGRISIFIALSAITITLFFGSFYGAISGYFGGFLDQLLMRIVDVFLSFPVIVLALTTIAIFGFDLLTLVVIISMISWMDIARLVRAEVLSLKQRPFVYRARACGLKRRNIIFRYLIPNTFATIISIAILRIADIMLIESALSFIGLGVQPPVASWGALLNDARPVFTNAWWMVFFPGFFIILTTLSISLVGEGLRRR